MFELSHPDPAVDEHNIVVRSTLISRVRFGELIGQMSLAHREGEDEIQGKQWLRSCRKPNYICEALERDLGETECCIARWLIQGYKYYVACSICIGWPIFGLF